MDNLRPKNRGLLLLRRSGDRQETSLEKQLTWAIHKANSLGVNLDASVSDIAFMQLNQLCTYKAIRLDDAVPGNQLNRPGLRALQRDVEDDATVSHIFVFARDRIGRPDSPLDCMMIEYGFVRNGATLVVADEIIFMPASGQMDITQLFKGMFAYHISGEQPRKLAEQMLATQRVLVEQNRVIGGNAPFGFIRVLVDAQGNEIERVPKGKRVRQAGCHYTWKPDTAHPERLKAWLKMLELKEQGWGYKRIAKYLTEVLKIPSPNAGQTRKNHGRVEIVEGRWSSSTVKSLLENRAIIGEFEYGRHSEGKHRRLGPDGPRYLLASEHIKGTDDVKKIRNDQSLITRKPLLCDPQFDRSRWEEIHQRSAERGRGQRGIARASDPAKYPLACAVFDLTDNCG